MNLRERCNAIIDTLIAVETLEYHDKNFLCNPIPLNKMKKELLHELKLNINISKEK